MYYILYDDECTYDSDNDDESGWCDDSTAVKIGLTKNITFAFLLTSYAHILIFSAFLFHFTLHAFYNFIHTQE